MKKSVLAGLLVGTLLAAPLAFSQPSGNSPYQLTLAKINAALGVSSFTPLNVATGLSTTSITSTGNLTLTPANLTLASSGSTALLSLGRVTSVVGAANWAIGNFGADSTAHNTANGIEGVVGSGLISNADSGSTHTWSVAGTNAMTLSSTLLNVEPGGISDLTVSNTAVILKPNATESGRFDSTGLNLTSHNLSLTTQNVVANGTVSGTWSGGLIPTNKGGTNLDTSSSTGVTQISSGTWSVGNVGVALINATGSASSSTYLRGDGSWSTPSGLTNPINFSSSGSFTTTNTQVGSDVSSGNLTLNVPTGSTIAQKVNGTAVVTVAGTAITLAQPTTISTGGLTVTGGINLQNADTASSVQNGVWGTSTGLVANTVANNATVFNVAGTGLIALGKALTTYGSGSWALGQYGANGSVNNAASGIYSQSATGTVFYNANSANHIFSQSGTEEARVDSSGVNLSTNSKKVIFGTAGTVTAGNYEIVGTSGGTVIQASTSGGAGILLDINGIQQQKITMGSNTNTTMVLDSGWAAVSSTTYPIMPVTGRHGFVYVNGLLGYGVLRVDGTTITAVATLGSGNYTVTASPTNYNYGWNISTSTLQLITGTNSSDTVSVSFRGL